MLLYKRNTRRFLTTLIIISTIFPLHQLTSPFSNLRISGGAKAPSGYDIGQDLSRPLQLPSNKYYIQSLEDNEFITDLARKFFINKNLREVRRLTHRFAVAAFIPLISTWIILTGNLYSFKPYPRTCSVMAYSMGGHAPPLFTNLYHALRRNRLGHIERKERKEL